METPADISRMAELLQVFVARDSASEAQHFLNHFARSNSWDIRTVPLEEHTVQIPLTGRERALYMNEVQRHGQKYERCVQLCSHFSADEACLDSKSAVTQTKERQQEERMMLQARVAEAERVLDRLPPASEERRGAATSLGRLRGSLAALDKAIEFFRSTLEALDPEKSSIECSVCLEQAEGETLTLTPCGHLFHEACIFSCIETNGLCPHCRSSLGTKKELIKVAGLRDTDKAAGSGLRDISRYGSKLCAVLNRAKELCAEDPQCKIIVFVQWEGLLKKVYAALNECGLPCLRITGTVQTRQTTLKKFQESDASEHRLLLLSLEKSPSGMTLTCANHVFLIHPMVADSPCLAAGYEKQAIGRVRRPGQEKTVHVWRFITSGTVEEDLLKQIQQPAEAHQQAAGQDQPAEQPSHAASSSS